MIRYRLDDRAAARRARSQATLETAAALAPIALAIVMFERMGYVGGVWLVVGSVVIAILGLVRGVFAFRRAAGALRAITVTVDGESLLLESSQMRVRAGKEGIRRARELPGVLGGLRLDIDGEDADAEDEDDRAVSVRVDLPRGGEGFGELHAALAALAPIERPRRRTRVAQLGVVVLVVLALFFLPFLMDDLVRRSQPVAIGVVVFVWVALRALMLARR